MSLTGYLPPHLLRVLAVVQLHPRLQPVVGEPHEPDLSLLYGKQLCGRVCTNGFDGTAVIREEIRQEGRVRKGEW